MPIRYPTPYTVVTGSSCGKQIGSARWWYHLSPASNTVFKISPLVHWFNGNLAVMVLDKNITLGQHRASHVHFCHVSNKRLLHVKGHLQPWLVPVRSWWFLQSWLYGPLPYLNHCLLAHHPCRIDSLRWRCSMWTRYGSMYQGQDQRQQIFQKRRKRGKLHL